MKLPPLSQTSLAPYVTVLEGRPGVAEGIPEVLEPGDVPGRHAFTVLSPAPVSSGSVTVYALERHPHSAQSFIPLTDARWLVLIAPTLPDGTPDVAAMRACVAGPNDAICIHRNVWHAGLTVFDAPASFGMIMWKADAGDDGVLHELDTPITLLAH
jgi:ureidoglycolate lyase